MKVWQHLLRQEDGLFFWYIVSCAGLLICHSTVGFTTVEEAYAHMMDFHPKEHF